MIAGLLDLVLDEAVGPGDAHHVDAGVGAEIEEQRNAGVDLLLVELAGFDFDLGILRQLQALYALELNTDPMRRGMKVFDLERIGRRATVGLDGVAAAELIAIQHGRVIAIEDREVEGFGIGIHAQFTDLGGMAGLEGEVRGAVGETGGAFIAQERGGVAEEHEVEVVIVVVIDPGGALEAALRQMGVLANEVAFGVAIEQRAGVGEDAEIHQAVVVEIAGGDGEGADEIFEAGLFDEIGAVAVQRDRGGGPNQQIGLARAGGIDEGHAGRLRIGRLDWRGAGRCGSAGGRGGRVVDFGVVAPFDIFGDGGAFGLLLETLELGERLGGFGGLAGLAIEIVKLKAGRGQEGIEGGGFFELGAGIGGAILQAVERAELVMRNGFVGDERDEALKLPDGLRGFA